MTFAPDRLSECIAAIESLVAFNTESSRSNLALIRWIESELERAGVPFATLPNRNGNKAAIFATLGPQVDGGVVLSGHTDVVPVAGQAWTSDPYQLRREQTRLYGRGACDMKGFVGVALGMLDEFQAARLQKPIHLLLTYDEETTCLGPVDAIARFGVDLPKPGCVIVGEPTSMRVADAHKSVSCYITRVSGRQGHSSRPNLGLSAIEVACALVSKLYELGAGFAEGSARFDPAGSTLSVGLLQGGTARNIIAGECAFEWEFRGEPDTPYDAALRLFQDHVQSILPILRERALEANIETSCEISIPGLRPEPGSAAEGLALRLTQSNQTNALAFATEAGRFQAAGLPVAICGPGSIDQAHQPDEYIELDQIEACITFMRRLSRELEQEN